MISSSCCRRRQFGLSSEECTTGLEFTQETASERTFPLVRCFWLTITIRPRLLLSALVLCPPWYHQPTDSLFWRDPAAPAAFIRKVAVIPSYQRRGIGTALLRLAEITAARSGAFYARGDTNPAFPELVSYYSKRGYEQRGVRDGNSFFEKRINETCQ